MIISVTQEIIDRSEPNGTCCPVALALVAAGLQVSFVDYPKIVTGEEDEQTMIRPAAIYYTERGDAYIRYLPQDVSRRLRDIDKGFKGGKCEIEPFDFELN